MAKKKSKECDKCCDKKKCANKKTTSSKNKTKIKATKQLKTLVSQAHPIPETFVQKEYNRLSQKVSEKFSQYPRLVLFKKNISKFYQKSIEQCKRLLYQV